MCKYIQLSIRNTVTGFITLSWWRHQMETFSPLLPICAGNSPVTGEFPAPRPVTRSFDIFFDHVDLRQNKRLSKQSCGWWFETHRAHYDITVMVPSILKYKKFITAWKYRYHNPPSALQGRHNGRDGSQITSFTIVYSTLYSGTDQRKHQSSASLAIVRWLVNSPHKWPVTREMFPFDDVFMCNIGKVLYHNWPSCSGVASFCSISTYNETQHF